MVPYDQLLPFEQAIVAWKIAHPTLFIVSTVAVVALEIIALAVAYVHNRKIEQERISRERAEKRAWIKANGGL